MPCCDVFFGFSHRFFFKHNHDAEMRVYKSKPTERNMFVSKRKIVTSNQGIFSLKNLIDTCSYGPICVRVFCVCVQEIKGRQREKKSNTRIWLITSTECDFLLLSSDA